MSEMNKQQSARLKMEVERLHRLAASADWLSDIEVIGSGPACAIVAKLDLKAYAWHDQERVPTLRAGPWQLLVVLPRALAVRPIVVVQPQDGYVPASANIAAWDKPEMTPGVICWAKNFDPTRHTLAWVLYNSALILTGSAFSVNEQGLSPAAREWQLEAIRKGLLPSESIAKPPDELLYVDHQPERAREPAHTGSGQDDIEFDD